MTTIEPLETLPPDGRAAFHDLKGPCPSGKLRRVP
jgi:hypothetical protein